MREHGDRTPGLARDVVFFGQIERARRDRREDVGGLAAEQVPADIVELLMYLFTTVLDGRNASVADGVERVLGRPARDFTDYARDAAATGVWEVRS